MDEHNFIANGRGKWSQKGVPHSGWRCVDIEDLGEPCQRCEMCEAQEIRYVHYMEHDQYPETLKVGCICSGNMEGDLTRAIKRDDLMKSRSGKRKRWLSRIWKISKKGNEYLKADGYITTVFFQQKKWKALIKSEDGSFEIWSKRTYESKEEVKLSAFDYITKLLSDEE